MVRVETGARLHFGFQNLSLTHERLYGGVGVALDDPSIVIEAHPASEIRCDDEPAATYLESIVDTLDVEGADLTVHRRFDRHVGLGSGTQLALACLVAVANAYELDVDPRSLAPDLGRGGRSGVGVATFERGGFVIDAGHPTNRFTTDPPETGDWQVPKPIARWELPESWRFVLLRPDTSAGPSDSDEDRRMRNVVERADPAIADRIATLVTRRLLPAVVEQDRSEFSSAVGRLGRLNGAWYADEQGGVYRPPAGRLVEGLGESPVIDGTGQSSWGSTVYGVTSEEHVDEAVEAAERVLADATVEGTVSVSGVANRGARIVD